MLGQRQTRGRMGASPGGLVLMPSDVVRFGDDFELDRRAYELRRSGRSLKLARIPMEMLLLLVQRKGQLVTREEIVDQIWGKDVFLDTDSSINAAIRKIRQALKDDPEDPLFVQTITGKGYRFVAPTVEVQGPAAEQGVSTAKPAGASWGWLGWRAALAAVLVVILAGGEYFLQFRARSDSASNPRRAMMAVLPFANLSDDPQQEYFSDGLTEEIITDLGRTQPGTARRCRSNLSCGVYEYQQDNYPNRTRTGSRLHTGGKRPARGCNSSHQRSTDSGQGSSTSLGAQL